MDSVGYVHSDGNIVLGVKNCDVKHQVSWTFQFLICKQVCIVVGKRQRQKQRLATSATVLALRGVVLAGKPQSQLAARLQIKKSNAATIGASVAHFLQTFDSKKGIDPPAERGDSEPVAVKKAMPKLISLLNTQAFSAKAKSPENTERSKQGGTSTISIISSTKDKEGSHTGAAVTGGPNLVSILKPKDSTPGKSSGVSAGENAEQDKSKNTSTSWANQKPLTEKLQGESCVGLVLGNVFR